MKCDSKECVKYNDTKNNNCNVFDNIRDCKLFYPLKEKMICYNVGCVNFDEKAINNCGHLTDREMINCLEFLGDFEIVTTSKTKNHYESKTGMQAIDVINAFDLNFNLGNVIKYTLRAGKKDDKIKDLNKAIDYLKYEIERTELKERIK